MSKQPCMIEQKEITAAQEHEEVALLQADTVEDADVPQQATHDESEDAIAQPIVDVEEPIQVQSLHVEAQVSEQQQLHVEEEAVLEVEAPMMEQAVELPVAFPNVVESVAKIYHRCSYIICRQFVFCIQNILKNLEANSHVEGAPQWHASFKQSMDNIRKMTPEIDFLFEQADEAVTLADSFKQTFGEEIEHLEPLNAFISQYASAEYEELYVSLVQRLKSEVIHVEDVVIFTRMFQEIAQVEYEDFRWDTSREQEMLQRGFDDMVRLYVSVLDALDLMVMSSKQNATHGSMWADMLDEVCTSLLDTIEHYDLAQINVKNMLLDGKYMISIGTIPQNQVPDLQKFEVYQQVQRGFMYRSTEKVMREAKVITVY
ncbi:MAG: nucleotide exchange factor GrpE [Caryophanon sp.]|nr:nucleotide exchange factor GrpE [Caryophanon sp.]